MSFFTLLGNFFTRPWRGLDFTNFIVANTNLWTVNVVNVRGKSLSETAYDTIWRQIVHWITSLMHEHSKLKPGENMCTEIVSDIQNTFYTQHVFPMFCKKKNFWQRFTCTDFGIFIAKARLVAILQLLMDLFALYWNSALIGLYWTWAGAQQHVCRTF